MRFPKRQHVSRRWIGRAAVLVCALCVAVSSHAAYISEIDLGGPAAPAGQGIELSQFGSAADHTLLIIDANPTSPSAFGLVLDVIHLPASIGLADVAMVTEQNWPDSTAQTTTLASLNPASGDATFEFNNTRLLVVMQGLSPVKRIDNPLKDAASATRYTAAAVSDWLVLGSGDIATDYQSNGHDIVDINATFGIDLLSRTVDKDLGRIVGRTYLPGDPLDMDSFFVGDPDETSRQFDVTGGYRYTYTPSASNLPLSQVPEPSSLAALVVAMGLVWRRRASAR